MQVVIERRLKEIEVALENKNYLEIKNILSYIREYLVAYEETIESKNRTRNIHAVKRFMRDAYEFGYDRNSIGQFEKFLNNYCFKELK